MPPSVVTELRAHRTARAAHRLRLKGGYEDHDLVCPSDTGGPIDERNLSRRTLAPILKTAKMEATLYGELV